MLIDSHCHLDFPELAADRAGVLARAHENGVGAMVTISTRVKRFDEIRAIAEENDAVWCSVGTHPHHAHEELDVQVDDLVRLSQHPRCVAIGEVGLDYHYEGDPMAQATGFRRHIAAARETGLPLVIHARDADLDIGDILAEEMGKGAFPAILHCYASGAELAARGLALGCHVSFSGIVTFKNSRDLQAIAASVPLDRLPKAIDGVRIIGIDVPGFGVPTHAEAKDVLAGAMLRYARLEAEAGPVARPRSQADRMRSTSRACARSTPA